MAGRVAIYIYSVYDMMVSFFQKTLHLVTRPTLDPDASSARCLTQVSQKVNRTLFTACIYTPKQDAFVFPDSQLICIALLCINLVKLTKYRAIDDTPKGGLSGRGQVPENSEFSETVFQGCL